MIDYLSLVDIDDLLVSLDHLVWGKCSSVVCLYASSKSNDDEGTNGYIIYGH